MVLRHLAGTPLSWAPAWGKEGAAPALGAGKLLKEPGQGAFLLGSFTAEGRDTELGDEGSGVLFPLQQLPGQGFMAGAAPPAGWHSGWKERSGVSTRHAAALRLPLQLCSGPLDVPTSEPVAQARCLGWM